jgi:hypothetical protein
MPTQWIMAEVWLGAIKSKMQIRGKTNIRANMLRNKGQQAAPARPFVLEDTAAS